MKRNNNAIEKSKKHFDSTAKSYNQSGDGQFTERMYESLLTEIRKNKTGTLLDVGCGNGNILVPLANSGLTLYGIDLSDAMIEEAAKRLNNRAKLHTANAEKLPFENEMFDILVCNASFHHYPKPETVLDEMNRVMKSNSLLYIGESYIPTIMRKIMNMFIRFSPDGDYHIYGKKELSGLLYAHGFEIIDILDVAEHAVLYVAKKCHSSYGQD